ncbi:MAG TPA: carboxypeptidase M32, partial [Nitrospira sp.]|nr:carboxypeptidase M32 [Nitrospira sp.]
MKTLKTLEPLTTRLREIQRINSAASVLSWDQETYMPAGGGAARAEQIATLQGIAHQKLVSPDTEQLLGGWLDLATGLPLEQDGELWDESSRALLREVWRDYSRAKKLPSDFVMTLSRECSLAQQVWAEAKEGHSFTSFLPNLRTVLSLKQQEADYLGYQESPYNALLDVYEPGSTVAALRPLFSQIKARLVPLLRNIQNSRVHIDDGFLFHAYDQARQVEFGRLVLIAMGSDFDRG